MDGGYLTQVKNAVKAPSENMTWTQLAFATAFVLCVAIAWRQIVGMILRD